MLFAAVVFGALRWLVPAITSSMPQLAHLGQLVAGHAHWVAAIFLLPLPFALFMAQRRNRLVDTTADLDRILALTWQDFETLVAQAYSRRGYRVTERGGAAPDGGVDLELHTQDERLVVQCKRWKTRRVGVQPVREIYGVMTSERAQGAIFVTSGGFTPDAIDFARDKPIKLLDGAGLVELLRNVRSPAKSMQQEMGARLEPRIVTTSKGPMQCPRCGNPMVKRIAKQGAGARSDFWGCSHFPACRGARNS